MNSKSPFNSAAQETDEIRQRKKMATQRESQRLEALEKERLLNKADDMERAERHILLEHNRLNFRPNYAPQKTMTSEQLKEQASRMVDVQYLRRANAIREECRRNIFAIENEARKDKSQAEIEKKKSPREIKTIFNGLPNTREGRDPERER